MRILPFFTLFLLLLNFSSCERNKNRIPQVPVNVVVNTLDPQYQSLNGIGGWAYVEGGSRGIVVFKTDFNEFRAYDRHCPYLPDNVCAKIFVDENNVYATDTCCGSSFQLIDGSPVDGPANISLQFYNTSFDGNIIQIWN